MATSEGEFPKRDARFETESKSMLNLHKVSLKRCHKDKGKKKWKEISIDLLYR